MGTGVVLSVAVRHTMAKVYYVQRHTPELNDKHNYLFDMVFLVSFNWSRLINNQPNLYAAEHLLRYVSMLAHFPDLVELTPKLRAMAE